MPFAFVYRTTDLCLRYLSFESSAVGYRNVIPPSLALEYIIKYPFYKLSVTEGEDAKFFFLFVHFFIVGYSEIPIPTF